MNSQIETTINCYHCGDVCPDDSIKIDEKYFCCNGCKTVYEILDDNKLCNYYNLDTTPGITPSLLHSTKFDYLDDQQTIHQIIDFTEDKVTKVTFDIPQMHCSSCIWLLENLFKINKAITNSQVDFLKKKLTISFNNKKISLKELVQLLTSIGYEPQILLDSEDKEPEKKTRSTIYYRVGVAGFCFINIMMLSFPEYLGIDLSDAFLKKFFLYLNLILSLPVFLYSSWEYFGSALKGLRKKIVNIDFPISLGILVLFIRSAYEVLGGTGAGYFDSLTGLVFFLLIGKLFQEKTYGAMNFERNYKSFFPLAVTIEKEGKEKSIPLSKLMVGNRILVRQNELIPADSILFNGHGKIDYSFVTGEAKPVEKVSGEMIYAGGRQIGGAIELEVIKEVSQSYLTQLWNNDIFNNSEKSGESGFTHFSNVVSKYFTAVILLIAICATLFWLPVSAGKAINVFTAILIVACPCALALSIPFTLCNTLRIFGKNKFFIKNIAALEEMGRVDTIVFDKTGTLTKPGISGLDFNGKVLTQFEQKIIKSLSRNSVHPLSKKIYSSLEGDDLYPVTKFVETTGMGLEGVVFGHTVKIGSKNFVSADGIDYNEMYLQKNEESFSTKVYLSVDEELIGYFEISNSYREGIDAIINTFTKKFNLSLLSGDNEGEKQNLLRFFKDESQLFFNQSPEDKLYYIKNLQSNGSKVLMAGDGLNDAGALKQSDVGIAVTEDSGSFSPASDAILDAEKFKLLPKFINFSKTSINIIFISFTISFIYNLIGLGFAVQGMLSPIIAAILMPLSSISVVVFATLSTNLLARRKGLLSAL
ncbi:MAG: heavy metal translocating P-type ATPase metal-binding domain-containing protein [Ignavibacteria bacterium]|nr:heavy metal translocating P-type ATPase metal-binding domain-containing protein [Ignavibacteria bacterium]